MSTGLPNTQGITFSAMSSGTQCSVVEEVALNMLTTEEATLANKWQLDPAEAEAQEWTIIPGKLLYNRSKDTFIRIKQQYAVVPSIKPPAHRGKPPPALPVEAHSAKHFDAEDAWAAVVALSRGS